MHTDITAVIIQSNKIVLNEVKDNQELLKPSYGKPNFLANAKLLCKYFSQPRDEANKVHIFYFKMFFKYVLKYIFRKMFVVQCVRLFPTPCTAAHQDSLSFTISQSLLKLMSIESVMPSNYLILCHPFSSCPQSLPASVFSSELTLCIMWPKYWSFSISSSNEYSGLIFFRITGLISLLSRGL